MFSPWFLTLKGADTCHHSHAVAIERVKVSQKAGVFRTGAGDFAGFSPRLPISGALESNPKRTKTPPNAGFSRKLTARQTATGSTVSLVVRSQMPR
jgi:hypothetical protein